VQKNYLEVTRDNISSGVSNDVSSLEQRAKELHGLLNKHAQNRRTTAVAKVTNPDGTESIVVASSRKRLDRIQRQNLKPNEVEAIGEGHAEVTIINHAMKNEQIVVDIAASRPICPNCADEIKKIGANPVSPLKKTKGRNK